jgi:hypothetical protein
MLVKDGQKTELKSGPKPCHFSIIIFTACDVGEGHSAALA